MSFNTALTQVYTNAQWAQAKAQDAQDAATAAGGFADAAHADRVAVDQAAQDVRDALDAIEAGPVASVNGRTGVVVGLQEALVQRTSTAADNGVALVMGSEYALSAGSAYSRPLPAGVAGNQIVFNSAGGWGSSLFTLGRANAAHTINGVADNVLFDAVDARRVIASCTAPGAWVLSVS
ncbi:hypothetical protein HS961_07085 [Comamonas piscis]|uniref:Uncharacterized protein n=1 Tax=Comamonas piscis TaxID=1562974 RepID=A0A7G5EF46_9BURK|nr:hypothetical protein [Comamonas piscis]QMV72621.1 hypothetical protein HS961_07085 [Comamonas piscis]WSO35389.1 hypothetical protein VUJ63_07105 [Comamonas piscis]